jgi:IS605 OrfB family transposase
MSGKTINQYREKRQRIRSSIQAKGTKGAKKLLKRLSGKERRATSQVNHSIAKNIVKKAVDTGRGIVLENLKGIRENGEKKGKAFRSKLGKWGFYQLKQYIEYKARLVGIPVISVAPAYSSQMCNSCFRLGSRNGESFKCSCGNTAHADLNAAMNIRLLGLLVNRPEKSTMYCMLQHS